MIKFINYFIQSVIIYCFFLVGFILGIKNSRIVFSYMFSLIGPIFRSKKIVKRNLEIFSSQLTNKDKSKIINEMWKNYGKTFIEYILLKKIKSNVKNVIIKGEENIFNVIEQKKPVIFVSGHFANFEIMSMEITKRNIKLATIYRPLNNFFLNPFMEYLRKKNVCKYQIKKGISGVRDAIKFLKKDYSIAMMIDQRVSEGEKINFFNKPALTTTLPAQLSMKLNLKIVPIFIERTKDDKFLIEFLKPIDNEKFQDKIELSKELNKILENMINRNPFQWIWTHNRWK